MAGRDGLICQEQIWTAKSWAKPEHMDVRVYRTTDTRIFSSQRDRFFFLINKLETRNQSVLRSVLKIRRLIGLKRLYFYSDPIYYHRLLLFQHMRNDFDYIFELAQVIRRTLDQ
jgi:hypothetical protein